MPKNIEIERKFVVNPTHPEWIKIRDSRKGQRLIQSTIHKELGYKLRIRMVEDLETGERSSFFCFKVNKEKNKRSDPNMRDEYEWPVNDRNALYMMIGHGEVSKIRREWDDPESGLHYAIDEYEGANAGIITVDVEMHDPTHEFEKAPWMAWEVTTDARLKNSSLQNADQAFAKWSDADKKWYASLTSGDGVVKPVLETVPERQTKIPKSFWKRLKKAWKILRGKEDVDTL